ncbi:TRAP transporter small permease [Rhodobacteraceae bacterium WD3A24]|nr:TRAP transporter small permease [Rhodobacteraceae bacterium WD3A24]
MLAGVSRAYDRLVLAMAAVSAAIAAGLVVMICLDVALRNIGWGNLPWAGEVSEYGLYLMTILGAPWVLSRGGHVKMDIVANHLRPASRRWLNLFVALLGLGVTLVLTWYGAAVTLASMARGSLMLKTLVFPEWWLLAPLPVAMAIMAVGFLRDAGRVLAGQEPGFHGEGG